jgi:hypothetical protein
MIDDANKQQARSLAMVSLTFCMVLHPRVASFPTPLRSKPPITVPRLSRVTTIPGIFSSTTVALTRTTLHRVLSLALECVSSHPPFLCSHIRHLTITLAYTNFTYADLAISGAPTSGPATGTKAPGGPADLFETVATVTATITNSGAVAGAEVPQLYIGYPASAPSTPPKQLRGFNKLKLAAGANGVATFKLRRRDLSVWDGGKWVVPKGEFTVYVGASSRDVRLTGKITV